MLFRFSKINVWVSNLKIFIGWSLSALKGYFPIILSGNAKSIVRRCSYKDKYYESFGKVPENPVLKFTFSKVVISYCFDVCTRFRMEVLTHFSPVLHFYTPLKTSVNKRFSDVFRGYRNVTLDWNGLIWTKDEYKYLQYLL